MSPRAATASCARCISPTRRRIHGPSSRTAAAASRSAARRGSTTCTPRCGSTVTRTRRARGERRTVYSISSPSPSLDSRYGPALTCWPSRTRRRRSPTARSRCASPPSGTSPRRSSPTRTIRSSPRRSGSAGRRAAPSSGAAPRARPAERAAGRGAVAHACSPPARTDECIGQIDVHDVEPDDGRAALHDLDRACPPAPRARLRGARARRPLADRRRRPAPPADPRRPRRPGDPRRRAQRRLQVRGRAARLPPGCGQGGVPRRRRGAGAGRRRPPAADARLRRAPVPRGGRRPSGDPPPSAPARGSHGRCSCSADRIARVAGERFCV